jgi:hypothetical protein
MRVRLGDALCGHPSSIWHQAPDLITGKAPPPVTLSCHLARKKDWPPVPDTCGLEGKRWETIPAPRFEPLPPMSNGRVAVLAQHGASPVLVMGTLDALCGCNPFCNLRYS